MLILYHVASLIISRKHFVCFVFTKCPRVLAVWKGRLRVLPGKKVPPYLKVSHNSPTHPFYMLRFNLKNHLNINHPFYSLFIFQMRKLWSQNHWVNLMCSLKWSEKLQKQNMIWHGYTKEVNQLNCSQPCS